MNILFTPYAKWELEDAVRYYELEFPTLGERFKEEVKAAALRIASNPYAWSIESGEIRRYLLHRFPYKLIYSIEKAHILIIALAHQHRKPDYWIERHPD